MEQPARPASTNTLAPSFERLGLLALGAVLARIGGDKPMTTDFWILFGVAALLIGSAGVIQHFSAVRKWKQDMKVWERANELVKCSICSAMDRREIMQTDPVGQPYCARHERPAYKEVTP